MTDLIGGQVPYTVDTTAAAVPQVKAGAVRALATTASKRSALLPDVPTAAASGLPEVNVDTWLAVVGPKGLPTDARALLEKAWPRSWPIPYFKTSWWRRDSSRTTLQVPRSMPASGGTSRP